MRIVDCFKNLLSKNKKDYMLNEGNVANKVMQHKKEFIPKMNIDNIEHKKSRKDIIRSLKNDIIVEDLSEEYNYTKFSPENIREKYDPDSTLSEEDMTALSCLYGAIKDGNMRHSTSEIVNGEIRMKNNKINDFLKKAPDNIIILINLMEKDARNLYEGLGDKKLASTTIQGLIPGSYGDISQLIEEYEKESEVEVR